MIVTKFHENRLTIDQEISENMRSWLITFNVTYKDVFILKLFRRGVWLRTQTTCAALNPNRQLS